MSRPAIFVSLRTDRPGSIRQVSRRGRRILLDAALLKRPRLGPNGGRSVGLRHRPRAIVATILGMLGAVALLPSLALASEVDPAPRDPFLPSPVSTLPLPPLRRVSIRALELVAVLRSSSSTTLALLQDVEANGFLVSVGSVVGVEGVVVVDIQPRRLTLEQSELGSGTRRRFVLDMAPGEAGSGA